MTNVTLNYRSGEDLWMATGWMWPMSGYVDFISWGATRGKTVGEMKFDGADMFSRPFTTLSVDYHTAADTLDGGNDIILSRITSSVCKPPTPPQLQFMHALTNLKVALKAKDELTAEHLQLSSVRLDSTYLKGRLNAQFIDEDSTYIFWTDTARLRTAGKPFTAFGDVRFDTITSTDKRISDSLYIIPTAVPSRLVVAYRTAPGQQPLSFTFPFLGDKDPNSEWLVGRRYTYNLTCTLRKIETTAEEEDWNMEIGGTAYEPNWEVEISTGAMEATWNTEIGGDAYEMTWRVELSITAMESEWLTEIGATAGEGEWNTEIGAGAGEGDWNSEIGAGSNEEDWNSEIGAGSNKEDWNSEVGANSNEEDWNSETSGTANEENWNTETGGTASEENWTEETGGNAYEAPWDNGGEIIIE